MSEVALLWATLFMAQAGFYRKNDNVIFNTIFAYASYFIAIIWVTIYFVFEILPQI